MGRRVDTGCRRSDVGWPLAAASGTLSFKPEAWQPLADGKCSATTGCSREMNEHLGRGASSLSERQIAATPAGVVREFDSRSGGALRDHRLMAVIPPR